MLDSADGTTCPRYSSSERRERPSARMQAAVPGRSVRPQVRLIMHHAPRGRIVVLHPPFSHCESTQDVDYIYHSFVSKYRALAFPDAEQCLRIFNAETTHKFSLGTD